MLYARIERIFEPSGEQCGTLYDESTECKICGANRTQVGELRLIEKSIPKRDIAKTIGGEILVSRKFVDSFQSRNLKGATFRPILNEKGASSFLQMDIHPEIGLSNDTIVGNNPFDLATYDANEVYQCPLGHTLGLNLLSEPCLSALVSVDQYDIFKSKQKIGVKRGLLRPESLLFCAQSVRKMMEEEKLTGLKFEVAHIEGNDTK